MKKMLLIVAAVIVLAIAVFLLIGFFSSSYAYETRVTINRPRADVWRLFNDETKMGEWLKGFKSIETISGERNAVGSKYRMRFVENGREFEMIEEMKEFRPPEVIAFNLSSDYFTDDVRMTFNDLGDKTEVVQSGNVTGANILWRSLFFWMRSTIKQTAQGNLDRLKIYIESAK